MFGSVTSDPFAELSILKHAKPIARGFCLGDRLENVDFGESHWRARLCDAMLDRIRNRRHLKASAAPSLSGIKRGAPHSSCRYRNQLPAVTNQPSVVVSSRLVTLTFT